MCSAPKHHIVCTLVCVQWGIASWCILSWGVLGWLVCCSIIGRVWLLTASLQLVIALVAGPVICSFPLLIIGTVLLCKHLSQRSGWSGGGGLNLLHWQCIVDLWGWWCHKCGNLPHILLCCPSHGLSLLWWHRLCIGSCCSGLGHHSSIVWSLVLVRSTSSAAWLWCNGRWCRSRLWLSRD